MDTEKSKRGRHLYIKAHVLQQLEAYAEANNLSLANAVNDALQQYLKSPQDSPQKDKPLTKEDGRKILKRIELTNMLLEPALLELIETSAHSRIELNQSDEKRSLGRDLKKKYSSLFEELREILTRGQNQ